MTFPIFIVLFIILIVILIGRRKYRKWHNYTKCRPSYITCDSDSDSDYDSDINRQKTKKNKLKKKQKKYKTPSKSDIDQIQHRVKKIPTDLKAVSRISDKTIDKHLNNTLMEQSKSDKEIDDRQSLRLRDSINQIWMDDVCPGDAKIFLKELHSGQKNKKSIDARAKYDRNSFMPWVRQELDDAEHSVWWENENFIV